MANEVMDSIKRERVLERLRGLLLLTSRASGEKKVAEQNYKEVSTPAKDLLREIDGENGNGIRFWDGDEEKAAILSKPKPELSWDLEKLVPELRRLGVWDKVSTRVLDANKLASELASGNVQLDGGVEPYQYVSKDVAASIKFINPRPDSM